MTAGGMAYVRRTYAVPARRGGRVRYRGGGRDELGTIRSARNGKLWVQLDTERRAAPFHPQWELAYIDAAGVETRAGRK